MKSWLPKQRFDDEEKQEVGAREKKGAEDTSRCSSGTGKGVREAAGGDGCVLMALFDY